MFGRGLKVGTLFGIPVYLDISFFIIVPLFAWLLSQQLPLYARLVGLEQEAGTLFEVTPVNAEGAAAQEGQRVVGYDIGRPWLALVYGLAVTLGLYLSVLVHEFGHALTAKMYGVRTERVTLWFLGGIAGFERMPRQPGAEAVVAIAGPLTSLVVAGLFWALSALTSQEAVVWQLVVQSLAIVNVGLAIFNLIPALPLDGGRVLRSLLALGMPYVRATAISASIAKFLALMLGLLALLNGQIILVAIAIFIWMAVNAETRQSAIEDLLRGVRVGDLMVHGSRVETVSPEAPLGSVLDEMIRRRHLGFPVVDPEGRVLGVIGLRDFQEGFDPNQPAGQAMHTEFCRLAADAPAQEAFDEMGRKNFARCLVLDDQGRLEGMVTKADLMRLIQVRTAAMMGRSRLPAPDAYSDLAYPDRYAGGAATS